MPVFTIAAGTIVGNPAGVAATLAVVAAHAVPMGYVISAPAIGTSANAGKLQLTLTPQTALTVAQLTHLGLV